MTTPSGGASPHVLNKRRQNRRQIFWTASLATLIVLGMTLYDLKFRDYSVNAQPETFYHAVNSDTAVASVPSDNSELTVWQGVLTPSAENKPPVTPTTFAQRQVDLLFGLDQLDEDNALALSEQISTAMHTWDAKGNLVMDALLDVSHLPASALPALERLMADFHAANKKAYRVSLRIDPLDGHLFDGLDDTARADLLGRIYHLDIKVTPETADRAIAATDKLGHRFTVTVPAGTDLTQFAQEATGKAKYFRYFIRALPPAGTAAGE